MPRFSPEQAAGAARVASTPVMAVRCDDAAYPERLRDAERPPTVIYTRGTFAIANPPAVAIVGTRNATPYGIRMARALSTACASAGVCVVSGLARGIDAAAHEAALVADGRTVAVLGTGPDLFYPPRNRRLQESIAQKGLLLSEFPPGSTGHAGAFPLRNRLIAALADVTVIVEAPEKSGALYTAEFAAKMQRTVAFVPNAIDVPNAKGSNALYNKYDATPLLAADDLLELLKLDARPPYLPALSGDAATVWDAIQRGADSPAVIAELTALPLIAVQSALGLLEVDGLLVFDGGGRVRSTLL